MAKRLPSKTDFPVEVPGVGRYMFARRNLRDNASIRGQYSALTSGNYDADGNMADLVSLSLVTIDTLMVSAPPKGDPADWDLLADTQAEERLVKVYLALREMELSFRPGKSTAQADESGSEGTDQQLPVVVPETVQPAAN